MDYKTTGSPTGEGGEPGNASRGTDYGDKQSSLGSLARRRDLTPDQLATMVIGSASPRLAKPQVNDRDGWGPPLTLGWTSILPTFPVEVLPSWLEDFVEALSTATQTPPDLAAMVALAALASLTGGRLAVKARSDWTEPTNLYLAVAMPPASRKSSVYRAVVAPLVEAERAHVAAAGPAIVAAQTNRQLAERAAEKALADAAKAGDTSADDAVNAACDAQAIRVPVAPKLFVDDATPEALKSLLVEQQGRMAVLSAEGDVFELMAGRYSSSGPNLDVYLKGHAGDDLRVDRKGRSPENVEHPALTIGVTIQPEVLRRMARIPGARARGLAARFLFALPSVNLGHRQIDPPEMPANVENAYRARMAKLYRSLSAIDEPLTVGLDEDATEAFRSLRARLEPRLGDAGNLAHVRDWAGKLAGATLRLAGQLHVARRLESGWVVPIDAATMDGAVTLAEEYLIPHALAAFDLMGADEATDHARVVAKWAAELPTGRFTLREAHRQHAALLRTAEQVSAVLVLLEGHGWIQQVQPPPPNPRGGRKPGPAYLVNPNALTELTQLSRSGGNGGCVSSVKGAEALRELREI